MFDYLLHLLIMARTNHVGIVGTINLVVSLHVLDNNLTARVHWRDGGKHIEVRGNRFVYLGYDGIHVHHRLSYLLRLFVIDWGGFLFQFGLRDVFHTDLSFRNFLILMLGLNICSMFRFINHL